MSSLCVPIQTSSFFHSAFPLSILCLTDKTPGTACDNADVRKCLSGYESQWLSPVTPMSDQERTSHFSINAKSSRQVMRIKKNRNKGGFLVDSLPNSQN